MKHGTGRLFWFCIGICVVLLCGLYLMYSDKVPYNFHKLFGVRFPFLSLTSLGFVVVGLFTFPAWLSLWIGKKDRKRVVFAILLIVGQALAAYVLLRLAVPLEMIHKIVGYPVLNWPWEWELLGRFVSLCAGPTILLTGGCLCASHLFHKRMPTEVLFRFAALASVLLPVSHVVVVRFAGTDNLIELMANGGTWVTTIFISCWFFLISLLGSLLGLYLAEFRFKHIFYCAVAILLSVPVGYLLLLSGTEADIYKYEQHFSALQFLLSADREHYLSAHDIFQRYVLVHVLLVGVVSIVQMGFWCWHGVSSD